MTKKVPKTPKTSLSNLELRSIEPITSNQSLTFDYYDNGQNLLLHGYAGTGKTFCALYLALSELFSSDFKYFKRILIVRSVVPSRDMGFLPGDASEKAEIYEAPYREICSELFGRGDAYDILKSKGVIEFSTTSFLRGITFRNSIVLVDEIQNMTFSELDTTMTRLSDNSKVMFCGDFRQSDLRKNEDRGIHKFMSILDKVPFFSKVEFEKEDIVRSELVKEYIVARSDWEDSKG